MLEEEEDAETNELQQSGSSSVAQQRYVAVLGVEDVLMMCSATPEEAGVYRSPDLTTPDGRKCFLRPGCAEFVAWASENMDLVLWSNRSKVDPAALSLSAWIHNLTSGRTVLTVLGQEDSVDERKDLHLVAERVSRSVDRMFLVDLEERAHIFQQPGHAVPVQPYYGLPFDSTFEA